MLSMKFYRLYGKYWEERVGGRPQQHQQRYINDVQQRALIRVRNIPTARIRAQAVRQVRRYFRTLRLGYSTVFLDPSRVPLGPTRTDIHWYIDQWGHTMLFPGNQLSHSGVLNADEID